MEDIEAIKTCLALTLKESDFSSFSAVWQPMLRKGQHEGCKRAFGRSLAHVFATSHH